ncbi:phosphoglycerate dehydrogenase [bacterium]|nr:phosphoglycerate dehydrogenase [bacterium]
MKIQDFTVKSNLTVGVTTVAFSKDKELVEYLKTCGFKKVLTNIDGKRFSKDELVSFLSHCDIAIVGLDKIDESVLENVPNLKAISKYGVGLDNIDFDACSKFNVEVLHTQGVNKRSVSELTLGYMLSLFRNIYITSNLLKKGVWHKSGGTQLSNKTVGVIGVGNIGKDLIELLKPFNSKILVNDIINQDEYYQKNSLIKASKDEIFQLADVITIHTPLDTSTKNMVNKEALKMMKPTAFVINSARSGIINEDDLKWALSNNIIAGAAIDVYDTEPPQDVELISLANLITTPHIGGNAQEAVRAMGIAAITNLIEWVKAK